MKTTPIYGISYIEGGDLVSNAAAGFRKAAETTEAALKLVDQRSTVEGVKPVIAGTLASLATRRGATGQTGYVTSDGNNNGPYCWNGSAWVKYAQNTQINSLQSQIAAITQGYESGTVTLQTSQLGAASVRFAKHKTKPKAVLVTRVRNNQDGDDRARIFNPIVWDITATEFQVRFWRLDTHNWAESWPLTFSYLAIW
ncbi:hypothetical protein ACWHY2_01510 [Bifidobacterium longum]|uniref:hypothetical protein n=1 Tax=Bifidobacterium breve TaxID=1685 RepID=UPI00080B6608|nr:hypothetical protein [Bifidobacterium breve]UVY01432.1 MAG: hypothetical protein [Bacteriophage sp.]UVY24738.1 MAG: hypothetical protein [Bacteriophage sp.]